MATVNVMFIQKPVSSTSNLVYQIDTMLCCIMLQFVFFIPMNVGFTKTVQLEV